MKAYNRLIAVVVLGFALLMLAANIVLVKSERREETAYRVEAKRLCDEIEETGKYDLSNYPHLTGVYFGDDLYKADEQYLIIEAGGTLYRVEYWTQKGHSYVLLTDCVLGVLFAVILGVLLHIRKHIIVPCDRLNAVPRELAKGNLAVPIPQEKSRFLGEFTWGVNLLREKVEEDRQRELTMLKDRKLLLLSLSHDIKTPLSSIKLNAKALEKGLYKEEEKRRNAAESINKRADEIESFVSEITRTASEDFMSFDVKQGEVFLGSVIAKISERYMQQLAITNTEYVVGDYADCILACDGDRLGECLQNLMENAIKYGDGKRIELCFEKLDGCQLITVKNTGCALDEKELPQIFNSFYRGANAGSARGNGLGLFICKRLMSLMGGEAYAHMEDGCFLATLVVRLA